jgi:hypothetical protein
MGMAMAMAMAMAMGMGMDVIHQPTDQPVCGPPAQPTSLYVVH